MMSKLAERKTGDELASPHPGLITVRTGVGR
jgi:hypothetical protein